MDRGWWVATVLGVLVLVLLGVWVIARGGNVEAGDLLAVGSGLLGGVGLLGARFGAAASSASSSSSSSAGPS